MTETEIKVENNSKEYTAYRLYQSWRPLSEINRFNLEQKGTLKEYDRDLFLVALAAVHGTKLDFPKID